mgnify:FL=1
MENGKRVSCINEVQRSPFVFSENVMKDNLYGKDILVAVIDSGIDYTLPVFRYPDGTTRIRTFWDQTISGNPPTGYAIGTEYTRKQINAATCSAK